MLFTFYTSAATRRQPVVNSNRCKFSVALCERTLMKGTNVTFVLISTSLTWTDAQGYCREFYTDLASVRNMEENQKIKRLIPFLQSAWLGLSRESWKWSDGSDLTFPYWNWGEPNRFFSEESCVAANFKAGGRWEDWPCHWERSYICYTSGE
uniref:C-type lectin domain-containing protein n=1 Tax=Labrus bergylta TaxID=56723 RepID=A0A3Q3G8T9_9LABR